MRPLLPKDFLRKFPKRSVLAGVQQQFAALAKRPGFVATVVSIGIHGGLALSIPRLLPSSAQDDTAIAIETDVVNLSPTDLAAFSSMATAPAPRSSNPKYTDLNGQTLPNLSALRDRDKPSGLPNSAETLDSLDSATSSFGWGSASSYYDRSDRGASSTDRSFDSGSSSTSTYDATREDEFYQYWQRSQDLLDRFDQGSETMSGGRPDTGNAGSGGDRDDQKAIAGTNGAGGATGGTTAGTGSDRGTTTGDGFNSGASYTTGMAARQSYAEWAIAVQDENGLSDAELTPIFIPVSIPVPVTASSSGLIGEQGTAGLLIKPDGTPTSATMLSSFSSNELAKNLLRQFVLSGFSGCNVGIPGETWTACGLDITFVAANGSSTGTTTASAGGAGSVANSGDTGNSATSSDAGTAGDTGDAGDAGNAGNTANASGADPSDKTPNTSTTPSELTALLAEFEPDTPIAIAINEAAPAYREWRDQSIANLGDAADRLVFRAVPSALPYPPDLDPAFDRSLPTTAIVSLALNPNLTVIPETATVLRPSGNDQLDAIALSFAENTPRDWYATNLELNGDRGAIVLFTLSFVEPEGDPTATPIETNPDALGLDSESGSPNDAEPNAEPNAEPSAEPSADPNAEPGDASSTNPE
jgi:hypothetical protein